MRSLRGEGGEAGTCFWKCREMMGAPEGPRKDVTWQITNQACFGTADKSLDKESVGLLPAQVQALPKSALCHEILPNSENTEQPTTSRKKGQSSCWMKLPVKHFLVTRLFSVARSFITSYRAEEFILLLDSPFLLQLWASQVLNRQSDRTRSLNFFFLRRYV